MEALSLPQGSQGRLPGGGEAESEVLDDEFTLQTKAWKGVLACAEAQSQTLTRGFGSALKLGGGTMTAFYYSVHHKFAIHSLQCMG